MSNSWSSVGDSLARTSSFPSVLGMNRGAGTLQTSVVCQSNVLEKCVLRRGDALKHQGIELRWRRF